MTIAVKKISDDLYTASLTLPDVPKVKEEWSTSEPMRGRQLSRELIERGCHPQDIADAMFEQDPEWIQKLRDPFIKPSLRD